jgi:hypothetical protein
MRGVLRSPRIVEMAAIATARDRPAPADTVAALAGDSHRP